jgi:lipoteichoic acid synthase
MVRKRRTDRGAIQPHRHNADRAGDAWLQARWREYPGYSLLRPLPEDRTLFFSCFHDDKKGCASLRGTEKYIYHYDGLPEEFFDLSEDPFEEHNIVDERAAQEIEERRHDVVAWRARVNAVYEGKAVAG